MIRARAGERERLDKHEGGRERIVRGKEGYSSV